MADVKSPELIMLETDIGMPAPPAPVEAYLKQLLAAAETQLLNKGITINRESIDDILLLESYAAWLYRRRDSDIGMPRCLEYQLRNRLVQNTGEATG